MRTLRMPYLLADVGVRPRAGAPDPVRPRTGTPTPYGPGTPNR
ncbi:hypothetical protein ACH4MA_00025 [Streptomyces roseolus]